MFIIQRQKGDIGALQHGAIGLLRARFIGPQARTVVIVENHLTAVSAAAIQQRHQLLATVVRQDRQRNTAQVEVVIARQLVDDSGGLRGV